MSLRFKVYALSVLKDTVEEGSFEEALSISVASYSRASAGRTTEIISSPQEDVCALQAQILRFITTAVQGTKNS